VTIYATPGSTFEAIASNGSTGLAGTLTITVRDNQGAAAIAASSTGITEDIANSGIYRRNVVAPSTAGQYTIVWNDGSGGFAVESLVVTNNTNVQVVSSSSAAYGQAPITVDRDAVRLLVGDISTSAASQYLANGDYDYFLAITPNNYVAASMAANSLAALFSNAAASGIGTNGYLSKSVGDLTLTKADASNMAASYKSLAQRLSRQNAAGLAPYAGGLSVSGKRSVEQETDRVRPAFSVHQFDNPGASNPKAGSTST